MKAFILGFIVLLFGCAPLTNLESGKTVGFGTQAVQVTLSSIHTPTNISYIPQIDLKYAFGIKNNLDIGIGLNSSLSGHLFAKLQLIGDQESVHACSSGFKIGYFFLKTDNEKPLQLHLPFYYSYHPSKSYALFLNPMYMRQILQSGSSHFIGGTSGVILYFAGNELSFGASYYDIQTRGSDNHLISLGLGYLRRF